MYVGQGNWNWKCKIDSYTSQLDIEVLNILAIKSFSIPGRVIKSFYRLFEHEYSIGRLEDNSEVHICDLHTYSQLRGEGLKNQENYRRD